MLVILVTVVTQGARVPTDLRGAVKGSLLVEPGVFQAIGVISFAFVCHHNSLLIYGSLEKPTMDRFARVTHISTTVSMAACLAMALAGFLVFGDKTQGNVLNNFPTDNIVVNIARLQVIHHPNDFKQTADDHQLLWPEHADNITPRGLRLPGSHDGLLVPR
ncbi:MAG: hypothetical protein Q9186_002362 [Xanthomendoza sp. 1 TL-2023]